MTEQILINVALSVGALALLALAALAKHYVPQLIKRLDEKVPAFDFSKYIPALKEGMAEGFEFAMAQLENMSGTMWVDDLVSEISTLMKNYIDENYPETKKGSGFSNQQLDNVIKAFIQSKPEIKEKKKKEKSKE